MLSHCATRLPHTWKITLTNPIVQMGKPRIRKEEQQWSGDLNPAGVSCWLQATGSWPPMYLHRNPSQLTGPPSLLCQGQTPLCSTRRPPSYPSPAHFPQYPSSLQAGAGLCTLPPAAPHASDTLFPTGDRGRKRGQTEAEAVCEDNLSWTTSPHCTQSLSHSTNTDAYDRLAIVCGV